MGKIFLSLKLHYLVLVSRHSDIVMSPGFDQFLKQIRNSDSFGGKCVKKSLCYIRKIIKVTKFGNITIYSKSMCYNRKFMKEYF